ncbi:MAG: outer-membrane lipoprotein carrier protein LolA [Elusimicrobia bacterium]|nr:outer-membrane lipoprotein carrier protein LolA [Elusimicrobiota bacterium]
MKIFLTAFAACAALALAAHAGEAGKAPKQPVKKEIRKAKEAPKAKAPVSTATTKKESPAAGITATPAALVIGELMKWDQKLLSLRARFTQEFDFTEAGLKQHIEGALDYKKPDLLKIEHIKPARQLVYTDKKDLWVYKPEDSQVLKTSWAAWKKTQDNNFSGILDFGNYASLTEKNSVTVSTNANAPYLTVTFTSKSEPQAYKLTLILSATDYFPVEAALSVEKTLITTKFESVEKNIPLDDAVFRFIQPKGTELLEFNN